MDDFKGLMNPVPIGRNFTGCTLPSRTIMNASKSGGFVSTGSVAGENGRKTNRPGR
jgi:hypothetical protein